MSRRTSLFVLVLSLAVVLGVYAADLLVEPVDPDAGTGAAPAAVEPVAGSWVCPVGDGRDGTETVTTVARPPSGTDTPSDVEVFAVGGGQRAIARSSRLFDGSALSHTTTAGDEVVTAVDWRGGPAVVQREWTLGRDAGDLPAGIVAGACVEPFSDRWTIPGLATSGGAQAVLRVANPFPSDATIAIGFVAPEGPLQPLALRNLSVRARDSLEIDVNEFLPERPDLAAVVTVASGRVAVEGYQLVRAAIGGVDGVSPLAAATEASESWTVPWVVDGDDLASWLWVYNPGERQALVELTYHTPDGGIVPDGLAEVVVDPGQLRRVDLRGTLPEGRNVAAVSARSDGAPIVVSAANELRSDDAARSGFAVQLGAVAPDVSWTVSGGATNGRVEQLHISNPGGSPATLSVEVFTGVTIQRPDELQGLTIEPGAHRVLEVDDVLGDVDAWTAFVTATSGDVVVGRVGSSEVERRNLVAVPGVPSAAWRTESSGREVIRDDGLLTRYATALGIARAERFPSVPEQPGTDLDPLPDADIDGSDDLPAEPDDDIGQTDQPETPVDPDLPSGDADPDAPAGDEEPGGTTGDDADGGDAPDDGDDAPDDGDDGDGAVGDRLDEDLFGRSPPDEVEDAGSDADEPTSADADDVSTDASTDAPTDEGAVDEPDAG